MKRCFLLCCLLLALVFSGCTPSDDSVSLTSGCLEQLDPETRPQLTVSYGNEEKAAIECGFCWESGGEFIIADAPHPTDSFEKPTFALSENDDVLSMTFDRVPQEVSVFCYLNAQDSPTELAVNVNICTASAHVFAIEPVDSSAVYEVVGAWEQGSVRYVFAIDAPDAPFAIPLEQLPADYTVEQAIANGDFINAAGRLSNVDALERFMQNSLSQTPTALRRVDFTAEGDPIITDLAYDGECFTMTIDSSRDQFGGGETLKSYSYRFLTGLTRNGCTDYYLTNVEQFDFDDIAHSEEDISYARYWISVEADGSYTTAPSIQ